MDDPENRPDPGAGTLLAIVAALLAIVPTWAGWATFADLASGRVGRTSLPLALGLFVACVVATAVLLRFA